MGDGIVRTARNIRSFLQKGNWGKKEMLNAVF
jgi:hypothetical protein